MIEKMIMAIAGELGQCFPESAIYTESVPQGFRQPCFFICLLNSLQKSLLGGRFLQSYFFDVQYFPKNELRSNRESNSTAAVLYDILEYIRVDTGLIRGVDMRNEQTDGVLHFFVTYHGLGERIREPSPYMEHLKVEGRSRQHGRERRKEKDGKA